MGFSFAQSKTATKEVLALVGPIQWSATINDPPCALQVYIGRVNTTQNKSSCRRLCIEPESLGGKLVDLKLFSREEGGQWYEGAQPWSAWEQVDLAKGCAVYKNWSNNRFREARIVLIYEVAK
jgi:hypothetical protein